MLQGQLIVCFATLSWEYLWQRHQELMARFGQAGNRVLYVEPIGIRMPGWQDRHRIVSRVRHRRGAGQRGIRPLMPGVWGVDPILNPFQQVGFVHQRNVQALTAQLEHAIAEVGGGKPLVWTYVPTNLAREVIANLSPALRVYDCVDALTENPKGVFRSYAESEMAVSREADIVFCSSQALLERQLPLNPHTYLIPHGVQYEEFAEASVPEPEALKSVPNPRLAFYGGIDERVDLELFEALAVHHPDWQIVLMGVVRTDVSRLQRCSNVHFLGQILHDTLPAYLHHCDVFLLPYVQTAFSRYINPAKLQECLAVGKPTVAIALPTLREYGDVLYLAANAGEFEARVNDALAEGTDTAAVAKRRARARENTWDVRFAEMNALIAERWAARDTQALVGVGG